MAIVDYDPANSLLRATSFLGTIGKDHAKAVDACD